MPHNLTKQDMAILKLVQVDGSMSTTAIAEQTKWLAAADDAYLTLTLQLPSNEARETARQRIQYLEALADKLER